MDVKDMSDTSQRKQVGWLTQTETHVVKYKLLSQQHKIKYTIESPLISQLILNNDDDDEIPSYQVFARYQRMKICTLEGVQIETRIPEDEF